VNLKGGLVSAGLHLRRGAARVMTKKGGQLSGSLRGEKKASPILHREWVKM